MNRVSGMVRQCVEEQCMSCVVSSNSSKRNRIKRFYSGVSFHINYDRS